MAGSAAITASAIGLLLAVLLHSSDAIRCFVCSSKDDPYCGDPFNAGAHKYTISDCEGERSTSAFHRTTAVCRKLVHRVDERDVVVRSCAWTSEQDSSNGPCSPSSTQQFGRKQVFCSICSQDECNAAHGLNAPAILTSVCLAFIPLIKFF